MRSFKAKVAGIEYEIPATMKIINEAEAASSASFFESIAENRIGAICQGVIYAGLKAAGIEEVAGQPLTYEAIGELCDMAETFANHVAFGMAMAPDLPESGKKKQSSKNVRAEEPAAD